MRRPTLESMATVATSELVEAGALPPPVLAACLQCIRERRNVLVAGPTGTGKTTLLQALARHIPDGDSVLVIDEGGGLKPARSGWRRVGWRENQTRGSFLNAVRRALVRNGTGRPRERLIADGPCGPEAADILEALDLGRGGSLLAIQSTGIEAALLRLADLAWAPGQDRGHAVHLVAARIHLAVYLDRDRSGDRRVKRAARVTEDGGGWNTLPLWQESSFDNGLGAAELERLAFLAEECAEAIQVVAKIVRHGWESRDPTRAGGPPIARCSRPGAATSPSPRPG